jgi:hypothetical protein
MKRYRIIHKDCGTTWYVTGTTCTPYSVLNGVVYVLLLPQHMAEDFTIEEVK